MEEKLKKHIDELETEANKKLTEAARIKKLIEIYPDLSMYEGRWKKIVFQSRTVNELCVQYDMRHTCGCCPDRPLEVWPYIEVPDLGKVYSNRASYVVGEDSYYGDIPNKTWEADLRAASISEQIIEKIREHFQEQKEKAKDRLDSAFDE